MNRRSSGPQKRESELKSRLSPNTKYSPAPRVKTPSGCVGGASCPKYSCSFNTKVSVEDALYICILPFCISTRSPGSPMTRLIRYLHVPATSNNRGTTDSHIVGFFGKRNTTTSPRPGLRNRYDNSSIIRYSRSLKFGSIDAPRTING